jgi:hypothetical protein
LRDDSFIAHFRLTGSQLALDDLEGVLPAFGIQLPGASKLHGGTVSANLAFDGPVDRLVTTGAAQLANARLSGFDLGAKLASVPALANAKSGSDLAIVALSSGFRIAPQGIHISNFSSQITGIGTLSGDGDIDPSDNLRFRMVARLANGGLLRTGFNRLGLLRSVPDGIPFQVVGTTSQPMFLPDLSGVARNTTMNLAMQAGQRAWAQNARKALPPDATAFAPTAKYQTTPETASVSPKHGFFHKLFHPHKWKSQKDETESMK